jgi:Uri superfamily endonuclease
MQGIASAPGAYVLLAHLAEPACIAVGALGERTFEAGYYLYVGSALGGLRARLARHLRAEKRLHWHIDYLLEQARVCEVWWAVSPERLECAWASALSGAAGMAPCAAPFGASDCRCATHLFYGAERPQAGCVSAALPGCCGVRALMILEEELAAPA